jgi:hypothetical protein
LSAGANSSKERAVADLIQVDNEFSSMGNKIEIGYDESGKVTTIKFQYKTVDILFEASALSAEDFVARFRDAKILAFDR